MRFISSSVLLTFIFVSVLGANDLALKDVKKIAAKATKEFESTLKKELKDAKRSGGTKAMTSYCIDESKKVLEKLNKKYAPKVFIKRVSLNNRNKNAKPQDNELKILKAFDLIEKSDAYEPEQIVQIVKEGVYKVYAPIQMKSRDCKKCHGLEKKVDKESKKRFSEVYKNDRGYGYKSGEVRGAVVVTISNKK
ncbi:MAG: DUF3365 domain-containing protein [Halarcobacter sp.]